jgi:coproporphyrinogen III oxidase-like Fe-S oxidoreductase
MEAPPAIGGCCRRWRNRRAPNSVGRIESLIADGAVTMTDDRLSIRDGAEFLVRSVASVFDAHLAHSA